MGPLLILGQGLKPPGVLLVLLGTTVTVAGLLPGVNFFPALPDLRGIVRKTLPTWFGRRWFVAAGAFLVYWGLTHGRR
jgi:hypothetical protein